MPVNTYWKRGDHNGICQRCGFEFKFSELHKTWDGLWVCADDWEPRHPQDYVRGIPDNQSVRNTSPETPDTYAPFFVTSLTSAVGSGDATIQLRVAPLFLAYRVSEGNYFYLSLSYANAPLTIIETVKVTATAGKTLTVVRAQLSTTAHTFSINDVVSAYLITQDVTANLNKLVI